MQANANFLAHTVSFPKGILSAEVESGIGVVDGLAQAELILKEFGMEFTAHGLSLVEKSLEMGWLSLSDVEQAENAESDYGAVTGLKGCFQKVEDKVLNVFKPNGFGMTNAFEDEFSAQFFVEDASIGVDVTGNPAGALLFSIGQKLDLVVSASELEGVGFVEGVLEDPKGVFDFLGEDDLDEVKALISGLLVDEEAIQTKDELIAALEVASKNYDFMPKPLEGKALFEELETVSELCGLSSDLTSELRQLCEDVVAYSSSKEVFVGELGQAEESFPIVYSYLFAFNDAQKSIIDDFIDYQMQTGEGVQFCCEVNPNNERLMMRFGELMMRYNHLVHEVVKYTPGLQ